MKTTLIGMRALLLLVVVLLATGCSSSSSPGPSSTDAGSEAGQAGATGAAGDTGTGPQMGAAGDTGNDAGEPSQPTIAVSQADVQISAGSVFTVNGAVIGTSAATDFTISNHGTADLTIGGVTVDGSDFSVTTAPAATVAAGSSTTFTITFSPAAVGTKTATVTIANNAQDGFSFPITGEATAVPTPSISVSVGAANIASGGMLSFGSVAVGTTMPQTLTIRNAGSGALVLAGNPAVTGGTFSLTTPPPSLTVAAGGTTTTVVSFAPTAPGDQTGSISIASNATASPTYDIDLTGTGVVTATGLTLSGANGGTSITVAGGTLQLAAAAAPAGAMTPAVNWTSGSATVATVDGATGLVTAVANGTTLITATASDGSGITGTISITVNIPFVYFVKQLNGTTTASLAGGTFTVGSTFGASGNAFKYVAPNYYGTVSNGFIAFPTPLTGDFSITANVTVTAQNKFNNACGIGLGMTTGFNGTDSYGYSLMRNASSATVNNAVVNGYYVSGPGVISTAATPSVSWATGTAVQLTFSRSGTNLTYGVVGTTNTTATSAFTNGAAGAPAYGDGPVYPVISFNNVAATITNLVIKDSTGATVFDSATGALVSYIPASLTLSAASVDLAKGNSTVVTATALAGGGAVSTVTAVSADPTIATASVTNGVGNSTITLTGLKGGVTTVTVSNPSDSNSGTNTKTIAVAVDDYATTDNYGSLTTLAYPAPGATGAYNDGELALTFDAPPSLNSGGSIKIFKLADGSAVDSIAFAGETQSYGATTINVGSQLVRVSGNTVFFAPHLGKLAYGTAYYVAVPTTAISGTLNTVAFNGLSNLNTVATWSFTTRAAPTLSATSVTVDGSQTSTANFRTVQGALGALATGLPGAGSVTINVAPGTYNELIHYTGPGVAQTINLVGPASNNRGDSCIIQYANGNGMNGSTQTRASAYFSGANVVLQNISLKNTALRSVVSQAESLYFASGTAFTLAAFNSSFFSNQDTIQTSGRSWFYNCFIEGNVDFIWGTGDVALIEASNLHFINDLNAAASYSLFVARTGTTGAATVGKGYILLNSTVNVDANVTAFFGRDAGVGAYYDQAALINVMFTGLGTVGAGLWNVATAPTALGDSSSVGWKSAGCTGLNLATAVTDPKTSATITGQATEYDTRDHILNRVVTVAAGVPTGFQAAATTWDVSQLATAWHAP